MVKARWFIWTLLYFDWSVFQAEQGTPAQRIQARKYFTVRENYNNNTHQQMTKSCRDRNYYRCFKSYGSDQLGHAWWDSNYTPVKPMVIGRIHQLISIQLQRLVTFHTVSLARGQWRLGTSNYILYHIIIYCLIKTKTAWRFFVIKSSSLAYSILCSIPDWFPTLIFLIQYSLDENYINFAKRYKITHHFPKTSKTLIGKTFKNEKMGW